MVFSMNIRVVMHYHSHFRIHQVTNLVLCGLRFSTSGLGVNFKKTSAF